MVDVETGKVEKVIRTDQDVSHMVEASFDGRRAFVTNIGSGSVSVIDLEIGKLVTSIPTGAGAEGIALSSDGKELWVTNRVANTLSIINTESLEIVDTLHAGDFPLRVKITPDGLYALVSNARSANVSVFDTKDRKQVGTISFEVDVSAEARDRLFGDRFGKSPVPIGIVIPPDGQFAYIANSNADVVAVVDLKAWKVVDWIKAGREPDGLGWSALRVQVDDSTRRGSRYE